MTDSPILIRTDDGVGWVTLNRPERRNAFDDRMIADLVRGLAALRGDGSVRAVVLRANGSSFSAGADLEWMKRMSLFGREENLADARELATLMGVLAEMPKPTVALVQGAALGGGAGLVACCDIAIAADKAVFGFPEARLGLIPAVIAPFVVQAIGPRAARRYFLTGERMDAVAALSLGLVHRVVPQARLEGALRDVLADLTACGPAAQAAVKDLVAAVSGRLPREVLDDCARRIAEIRSSAEGREGVAAFLERRPPAWRTGNGRISAAPPRR